MKIRAIVAISLVLPAILSCSSPVGEINIPVPNEPAGPVMADISDPTVSLKLGDINLDGRLDLAVGNLGDEYYVYLNDGSERPLENQEPIQVEGAEAGGVIGLADFDGDNLLDLAISQFSGPVTERPTLVYSNDQRDPPFVTFDRLTGPAIGSGDVRLATGDMDGNGRHDLVITNSYNTGGTWNANFTLAWYRNNGSNTPFTDDDRILIDFVDTFGQDVSDIKLEDFDGNGTLDVFIPRGDPEPLTPVGSPIYFNDGAGNFDDPLFLFTHIADKFRAAAAADLDGDGDIDVAGAMRSSQEFPQDRLSIWLNQGDGRHWEEQVVIAADTYSFRALIITDMNGDGRPDIVASTTEGLHIYLGQAGSAPIVADAMVVSAQPEANVLAAGDIDGDGKTDLVLGLSDAPNRVLLNTDLAEILP